MRRFFPQEQRASHWRLMLVFLAVGGATAVLYGAVFTVLWELARLGRTAAVSIAYAAAVVFHFYTNRRFTFRANAGGLSTHAVRYLVLVAVNYGITLAVMELAVSGLSLSPYGGVVLATGATFLTGYFLSRFWVFHP